MGVWARHPGTTKGQSRRRGGGHTHLLWLGWGRGRHETQAPVALLSRTPGAAMGGWRKGVMELANPDFKQRIQRTRSHLIFVESQYCMQRCCHTCLVCKRSRSVRCAWECLASFRALLNWPISENKIRIHGGTRSLITVLPDDLHHRLRTA